MAVRKKYGQCSTFSRLTPVRLFPVMIDYICIHPITVKPNTGVCMAHRITCLIPTCKNTCGRNNTKTTYWKIFFIGYHFINARKVSSAISSLNVREKTFEKSQHTKPIRLTGCIQICHYRKQPNRS